MFNPRNITIKEFDEVAEALATYNVCAEDVMRDLMVRSAIAVFEHYISDDYAGKLIIIAWPTLSNPPAFLGVQGEMEAIYVIE